MAIILTEIDSTVIDSRQYQTRNVLAMKLVSRDSNRRRMIGNHSYDISRRESKYFDGGSFAWLFYANFTLSPSPRET